MYSHPFTEEELPFLIGKHVTSEKGTGLVHTAPAHGHDDFRVALDKGIEVVLLFCTFNEMYNRIKFCFYIFVLHFQSNVCYVILFAVHCLNKIISTFSLNLVLLNNLLSN